MIRCPPGGSTGAINPKRPIVKIKKDPLKKSGAGITLAPVTHVLDTHRSVTHVTGDPFPSAPDKEPVALRAPLGPEFIKDPHREFKGKIRFCPLFRGFVCILLVTCDKFHDLRWRNPEIDKLLEDKIIEDQPREVGTIEDPVILSDGLIEVFQGTTAQRAFATHKLIEKNLFLTTRTGRVRGVHA
jgi:hypothetical protein